MTEREKTAMAMLKSGSASWAEAAKYANVSVARIKEIWDEANKK